MLKNKRVCFVWSLIAISVFGCRAAQNSSSGTKDIITITADGNNLAILYYITTPDGSTPGNAEEIVVRKQCGKLNAEYDVRGLSGNNYREKCEGPGKTLGLNDFLKRWDAQFKAEMKNLVASSDDFGRFRSLGIPISTLRQWQRNGRQEFLSLPELELSNEQLLQENLELKANLDAVKAEQNLVSTTIKIFGFQIQYRRLPHKDSKSDILDAIKSALLCIPLKTCLESIGLSAARYHHWLKRQVSCLLQDQSSCPRASPTRLAATEINSIKRLFTSKDLAHFSMTSLSWLGKKTGEVFASPSTWSRVIRELGLARTRTRIYPQKPKIGIRASLPGQIWHLDQTILRLGDGTRAFVQAIIDNFSRYVLAWHVSESYGGGQTTELLLKAIAKAKEFGLNIIPNVFVDSGVENLNSNVDQLISTNLISRTIAQIEIEFSNSMIEMLFHRLKHRYLFNIPLTNIEALKNGVEYFVSETNTKIPHSALKGATPEEVITGKWTAADSQQLTANGLAARMQRSILNSSNRCTPCIA